MKNKKNILTCLSLSVLLFQSCEATYTNEIEAKDVAYTYGANNYGQLGNGSDNITKELNQILGLRDIIQIEASGTNLALSSNGKVFAWGNNRCGQAGIGDTVASINFPRQVKGLPEIKKIASGKAISMALDNAGNVWVWGTIFDDKSRSEVNYSLSTPPLFSSYIPQKLNLSNIIDIDCGLYYCVAVNSNGEVFTWGKNTYGQLGDGTKVDCINPQKIIGISNIKKVSAGFNHTLAITNDNKLYSWGCNDHGELGYGNYILNGYQPLLLKDLQNVVDIAAGGNYSLCLLSDQTLWAWGNNDSGQLGISNNSNEQYSPVNTTSLSGVKKIAAFGNTSIATTSDNKFWVWGDYVYLEKSFDYYPPVSISNTSSNPTHIEALDHSKLISTAGSYYLVVK